MKLSILRVQTWPQALDLMAVRNSCREGMTHDTHEISEAEQKRFWMDQLVADDPAYEAYLFVDGEKPMGYGLIKLDGKRAWMTYGIIPEYRGKRLSRIQIQMITQLGYLAAPEVWIDVWQDNFALRGDIREGYEFVENNLFNGRMLYIMKHKRDRMRSLEAEWLRGRPTDIAQEMIEVDDIARSIA